jgi:hypothetical protein
MGFKLGTEGNNYAINGQMRTKLKFGNKSGEPDISVPGTPVIRKELEEGVFAEANMDGTIFLSDKIDPNSFEARQTIIHEMRHATDMKIGRLSYADDHVMYNGERFERRDVNGIDSILVDGEWKQAGSHDFPWENDANNGNHKNILV